MYSIYILHHRVIDFTSVEFIKQNEVISLTGNKTRYTGVYYNFTSNYHWGLI